METKNSGRQKELDIARGLAVIFMVLIHTVEYYWDWENIAFGKVANFLGSPPSGPVFMFLLGVGIIYSKRSTAENLLKRGLTMLGLSYVMNALVYVLPYLISSFINSDTEIIAEYWTQLYDTDILQFAGLCFIFFALTTKMECKPRHMVIFGVILTLLGFSLSYAIPEVENPILQAVTGLFWGTHEGSYFPLTSWILYPVAGYVFANTLKNTEDKDRLYKKICFPAFAMFLVFTFVLLSFYDWDSMMDGEVYYHQSIIMNIAYISFVLAWLGVCYLISKVIPNRPMNFLAKCSRNVTPMYVAQYVLIIYIQVLVVGDNVFNAPITLLIATAYTIIAYFAADLYKKLKTKPVQKAHDNKQGAVKAAA